VSRPAVAEAAAGESCHDGLYKNYTVKKKNDGPQFQDVRGDPLRELWLTKPLTMFNLCPTVIAIKVGTRGAEGRKRWVKGGIKRQH